MRHLCLACLCILPACAAGPTPAPAGRFELFVLGTAQDGGVPHLGCERECCTTARREGRMLYPACLGIHDRDSNRLVLLEATPAVEAQVTLLHELTGSRDRGRRPVDAVLLTHAHIGHYLGLAQFGREVASTAALPVHVSPRFATFLRGHGPWRQLVDLDQIALHEFTLGQPFSPIDGVQVTAVQVPHRDEFSDTVAFRVQGPRRSVLFLPDIDRWGVAWDEVAGLIEGTDLVYVDGTFYDGSELPDRDLGEIPHPPMVDTMRRLAVRGRQRPGSVRFLHLNHSNPALRDPAIQAAVAAKGFRIAERGERVAL